MNYENMKAAELRELCEQHGLTPRRSKADMIEELKQFDLTHPPVTGEPAEALEALLPASEEPKAPEPTERAEGAADDDTRLSYGRFYKRYLRQHTYLGDDEHESNLRDVASEATERYLSPYGPAFRVSGEGGETYWVYAVNVR